MLVNGMRFIWNKAATQSWKIDIALIAIISAELIGDHTGNDGEHGGLPIPPGIEKRCDTMEIWGSCVNPFDSRPEARLEEPVIWELRFMRGREVVAEVSRPDPESPDDKAAREQAEAETLATMVADGTVMGLNMLDEYRPE